VQFRCTRTDRNRTHITPTDKNAIDVFCIYCPDADDCYYIRPAERVAPIPAGYAQQERSESRGVGRCRILRVEACGSSLVTARGVVPRPSDYRLYIATKGTSQRVAAD